MKTLSSLPVNRRRLLQLGTCGAMANTTFLSALLNLRLTSAALASADVPTNGYKALVCIFLNGAVDGFQVLTPFGTTANDSDYQDYVASRTNLSLQRTGLAGGQASAATYGTLSPIFDSFSGKTFGVHPRLPFLTQLYQQGKATFIANVGSLIQPIANKSEFDSGSIPKPIGLFSHPDFVRHWQTAVPTSRSQVKGWAGKMADLLTDPAATDNRNLYTAISTIGSNIWQTGNRILPYSVAPQSQGSVGGAVVLNGYAVVGSNEYNNLSAIDRLYSDLQHDFVNQTYVDLLEKSLNATRHTARDAADLYQNALSQVSLPTEIAPGVPARPFDNSELSGQLATVARTIKARVALGQSPGRQVFMVQVGGWDHHSNLLPNQNTMLPGIDNGLKSFHDFLAAEGLLEQVTTFTMSDFGRTLSSNGVGSDHAWGNNMIVMGGAINPGNVVGQNRIWGSYPSLRIGSTNPLDTSTRGTFIPTTSTDAYHAELCLWLGIPNDGHLETILPNVRNFFSSTASSHPIGFLND